MASITPLKPYPALDIQKPVLTAEELGGAESEMVALVAQDGARSRGMLYRPAGKHPKVGVHLIHPRADYMTHYAIPYLVRAGYMVLGCFSRYPYNDYNCIHERLILDVAAGVQRLRDEGCEHVILLGTSGGSSVAPFYQKQAKIAPPGRLTDTPAGDPLDLNEFDLPVADGIVLICEHLGEGSTLLKWLDPSVTDESDPASYDPSLDMFHPDNGWRIPPEQSSYTPEFLTRYRAAQHERCRRIDQIARDRIEARRAAGKRAAELEAAGDLGDEWRDAVRRSVIIGFMEVYRTQADPARSDHSIEPDDRDFHCLPASPYSSRGDLVNWNGAVAVFLMPEAWLSTWSGLSSRAETLDNIAGFDEPLLVVHYGGDWCTTVVEGRSIFDAAVSPDKEFYLARHQDHFGFTIEPDGGRGPRSDESFDVMVDWLQKRFPV